MSEENGIMCRQKMPIEGLGLTPETERHTARAIAPAHNVGVIDGRLYRDLRPKLTRDQIHELNMSLRQQGFMGIIGADM